MAKRERGVIKGFLSGQSDSPIVKQSNNQISKQSNIQKSEKASKPVKRKEWRFKGFYISPVNEVRLKEIETYYLKIGERLDLSDIINLAIEKLYISFDMKDKK